MIADRFLTLGSGQTLDLASGRFVMLVVTPSGGKSCDMEWTQRCATLARFRHPALATLVDFGCGPGPTHRFEAYDLLPERIRVERRDLPAATHSLVTFLNAQGCHAEQAALGSVHIREGCVVIVPGAQTGYPIRELAHCNKTGLAVSGANPEVGPPTNHKGSGFAEDMARPVSPGLEKRSPCWFGIAIERPAVADVIVDMVEQGRPGEPRAITVSGPPGAGMSTLMALLGREVRLRGFIPISTSTLAHALDGGPVAYAELVRIITGRHVVVFDDGSGEEVVKTTARSDALARLLIDLGAHDARPHRIIIGLTGDKRSSLSIDPFSSDALRRMVSLTAWPRGRAEAAMARAIKGADGRPGPFLQVLRSVLDRTPDVRDPHARFPVTKFRLKPTSHAEVSTPEASLLVARPRGRPRLSRACAVKCGSSADISGVQARLVDGSVMVRESAQRYGADASPEPGHVVAPGFAWSACLQSDGHADSVEMRRASAEIRRRARLGCDILLRGEQARGERVLRDSLGGLIRREDHGAAGATALLLGQLTWQKGRTREATSFLATSRLQFELARLTAGMVRAAVYAGLAATDEGRLVEAEAALRGAQLAASRMEEDASVTLAGLALARCLIWQARYDEADRQLQQVRAHSPNDRGSIDATRSESHLIPEAPFEPHAETTLEYLATHVCLGIGDLPRAGRHASAALERAIARDTPIDRWAAHAANAAVQTRVGDLAALRGHVAEGLMAAKRAHLPLKAIRLRLYLIEGLLRAGRVGECRTLAGKLERIREASLPPLLRVRFSLVMAGVASAGSSAIVPAAVEAFVRSTGAQHLILDRAEVARSATPPDVLQEIVEILQMCHEADDERRMLTNLCTRIRERVRAAAVAFWVAKDGTVSPVVSTSNRYSSSEVVARALACALPLGPTSSSGGSEAAVPVRYGGAIIATLWARWLPDPLVESAKSMMILRAAAASAAPAVRGLLDRTAVSTVTAGAALESDMLGAGEAIENLRQALSRAARAPFAVLIEGESGTGKELAARAVHRLSPRRERKFCAVNCAALNDELIEAELFGHTRGAFTGAVGERIGLFEEADGGTLFLDEVGELSMRAQVKILRAIQEGEIRRVGESFHRKVDLRLVAATNRSLDAEVGTGRFRQDLLYRIDVIRIKVPPLRERIEDIPVLARHFWNHAVQRTGSRATLGPMAIAALTQYGWPGNVRELQNVMAALAVSAPIRGSIGPTHLPGSIGRVATSGSVGTLDEARRVFERRYVEAALARVGGHRGRAARSLGLSRQGLSKLLVRLALTGRDDPQRPRIRSSMGADCHPNALENARRGPRP